MFTGLQFCSLLGDCRAFPRKSFFTSYEKALSVHIIFLLTWNNYKYNL